MVYALDASSGQKKWSYQGDYLNTMPTVANGMIYGGTFTGTVYALAGQSGSEKWSYQTGENISFSPTVANGVVYVASHDNLAAIWPLS
jgi:outer membrane protein assembly factor BamB